MDASRVPEYVMNTLCRICAEKSSKLIPIFKDHLLPEKIVKCLPIRVAKADDLPLNVCDSCFVKLDESYMLYKTAQQSDDRLKTLWKILIKETLSCPDILTLPGCHIKNDFQVGEDCLTNEIESPADGVAGGKKTIILEIVNDSSDEEPNKSRVDDQEINTIQQQIDNLNSEEQKTPDKRCKQSNKTYQCKFCSRQLKTLASLSVHESTHSQVKPFLCDTCGKSFKHANNLKCHTRTHSSVKKKHICKICKKGFVSNFFLLEHMNSHTGDTPYKCQQCGKEFREKVHLRQHKWTHSQEKFSCPICGNSFNRKGNMKEHIKKFHQSNDSQLKDTSKAGNAFKSEETHTCPVCNVQFTNQSLLKNHLKLHPEEKQFSCLICYKKFRHSGSLTYHRRTAHTGEKPFQCDYCDQRFYLRSVKRIHERKIHTFLRPYKCSFCFRQFNNSSSLTNHLYVHSKSKMFECEDCGKKFSRSSNLNVHKKLHTGDRRFACDQCDKSYVQRHDLVKHRKVHDPKSKPFFCKYCGNSFSQKKDSAKHATCQFDFLQRKSTSDLCAAEKILDSMSDTFQSNGEAFFQPEELILTSVELQWKE